MNHEPQMIAVRLSQGQRKTLAGLMPELSERLKLGQRSSIVLDSTVADVQSILQAAEGAADGLGGGHKRKSLIKLVDAVAKAIVFSEKSRGISESGWLYQFKITLIGSDPPIWRRIQVESGTFDELHNAIQAAMGWENAHLYEFNVDGCTVGDYGSDCDYDSAEARFTDFLPEDGGRFSFRYWYDFGDDWMHEVSFERCVPIEKGQKYPVCIAGERACPPEDIGGIWGFYHCLEAISDPDHPEYEDFIEWCDPFDPDAFDAKQATQRMQRRAAHW